MIPFNIPPQVGTELDYMRQAMANNKICGDGPFTRRCDECLVLSSKIINQSPYFKPFAVSLFNISC